jgi:hypothetical protein
MSDVRVIGAAKIMGELKGITGRVVHGRAEACLMACRVFERHAKLYATGAGSPAGPHVGTGELRGSIQSRKLDTSSAQVAPAVEYAAYVEYGTGLFAEGGGGRKTPWVYRSAKTGQFVTTSGHVAMPFMRPAYETGKDEAGKVLAAHLAACVSFGKAGGSLTGPASPAEG